MTVCKRNTRTDHDTQTDSPKPIFPLNFFEVGGIKTFVNLSVMSWFFKNIFHKFSLKFDMTTYQI